MTKITLTVPYKNTEHQNNIYMIVKNVHFVNSYI